MTERTRNIRDIKGVSPVVLTDLSKVFDYISHTLLTIKLSVHGFDRKCLKFISAYLRNREQKTQLGSEFINPLNILLGVTQGPILDLILFVIFMADLFLLTRTLTLRAMLMIPLPMFAVRI